MPDLATTDDSVVESPRLNPTSEYNVEVDPFEDNLNRLDYPLVCPFFMGGGRRAVLDEVLHQCQFGNNLVAVLGESGVGKTALIDQAMTELSETAICCFVQASAVENMDSIFRQVINQLNIHHPESASAGEMLAAIRQYHPSGEVQRIVIIVDDAHHLNDQILAAIVSLLQGQQSYHLHVLLAGDYSLVGRLDKFEMIDVLISDISLSPFNPLELKEYLAFKMSIADYQGDQPFNDKTVEALWRDTKGLPAAVNVSARQLLAEHNTKKDSFLGGSETELGLPIWHMIVVVFLLAALIMALFYMGGDENADIEDAAAVPQLTDKSVPKAEGLRLPPPNIDTRNTVPPEGVRESVAEGEGESASVDVASEEAGSANTAPLEDVINSVSSQQKGEQESLAEKTNIVDHPESSDPAPKLSETPASTKKVLPETTPAKSSTLSAPVADVSGVSNSAVAKKTVPALTSDEQSVLQWPKNHYTLQVMAASQKASLERFVSAQPNKDLLRIVHVIRNNKPWYIVLVGVYLDTNQAREAAQLLPQAQVNAGPWPRKIADVVGDIQSFRRK